MPRSLESKLASALAPVAAPAELWSRVDAALPGKSGSRWPSLLMAAVLAALMSGGVLYLRAQATTPTFQAAALDFHQHPRPTGFYAVQRYEVAGGPVTVISVSAPKAPPAASKMIRTSEIGPYAISEWSSQGRRWAMVSPRATHRQACSVCHRA